ncbi:hypothetical protein J7E73_07420 [Paenibacillus albidus]|uniref:hypothetical protein n=1 Tax=Paenibacillus albidus TaxID=2041023 RepID=UPI001BEC6517|nr:hypothetical protein [Paenibacillus albidus]MBT2288963.1 hypothetical protein [Paenibacillus albidus]
MSENLSRVKLSQWDALLLEALRVLSGSDEELLRRVSEGDLPVDESEYEFDYTRLVALQEEAPESFRRAVREGYQIKYNTIRGIGSWLSVALGKKTELELEEGKEAVEVELTADEKKRVESVLSFGWKLYSKPQTVAGNAAVYRIEPIQR